METRLLEKMNEKIVKSFLDLLILAKLRKEPMSGYDFVTFINKNFHIIVSPDTIYNTLLYMERDGLIKGTGTQRKRVYVLTNKGKETIGTIFSSREKILGLVLNLFLS